MYIFEATNPIRRSFVRRIKKIIFQVFKLFSSFDREKGERKKRMFGSFDENEVNSNSKKKAETSSPIFFSSSRGERGGERLVGGTRGFYKRTRRSRRGDAGEER